MRRKVSWKVAATVAIGALALTACSTGGGDTGGGGDDQVEIKIGSPLGLSGPAAFVGISSQRALEIATDMINDDPEKWIGANRTISFDIQDIGSDESRTLTIAQSMIASPDVVGIVGPSLATQTFPLSEMLQSAAVPMIAPTSFAPGVTAAGDYVFQIPVTGKYLVDPLVDLAVNELGADKVGIVYNDDNQANLLLKELAEKALEDAGAEVVAVSSLFAETNFSTAITQLQDAGVEVVFIPVGQVASLEIQAAQAGFTPTFLGTPTMGSEANLTNAGAAAEGEIFATDYAPALEGDLNAFLLKEYEDRFQLVPDSFAAQTFAAVTVLAAAIKSIDGDVTREGLRDALSSVKDADVVIGNGKFTFDEDRQSKGPAILLTVKDGKFELYEK